MVGVIGGTGVLQGDQFTRAQEGRSTESHQKIGELGKMAKNAMGGPVTAEEGAAAFEAGVATQSAGLAGVAGTLAEVAPIAAL